LAGIEARSRSLRDDSQNGKGNCKGKCKGKCKCKCKCKCKNQYRGLSTALRFGRDDVVLGRFASVETTCCRGEFRSFERTEIEAGCLGVGLGACRLSEDS
jgi:hypothetical protein